MSTDGFLEHLRNLTRIEIFDDDFSDLFNSWSVKVGWLLTIISDLIISNVLFFLLIQFDKYGEDSMKRPLHNQLTSQVAYPAIIHNLVVTPSWALRIYFGPLDSGGVSLLFIQQLAKLIV